MQLNVLYWHVIDSQSFPLQVDALPELAEKGGYSLDEIYTHDDIQQVVHYANEVRVLIVPFFTLAHLPIHTCVARN